MVSITNELKEQGLTVGVVCASGVHVAPSPDDLTELVTTVIEHKCFPTDARRQAVRALLRCGGFKPSGRSKPASEYLVQAAQQGAFPAINNLVDINNLISLKTGFPSSILDRRAVGEQLTFRLGRSDERYVFNSVGHEIELSGLISACAGEIPVGNPVKDSLSAKLKPETTEVVVIVYVPAGEAPEAELRGVLEELRVLLSRYAGAQRIDVSIA